MGDEPAACGGVVHGCILAKALLARTASCECSSRRQSGEATAVDCRSPVAHHCETLAARQRHDSLADLPRAELVPRMQAWTLRRRARRP